MRKFCGLFAISLFLLACVYVALGSSVSDLLTSPLYNLCYGVLWMSLPTAFVGSISKRDDLSWLSTSGLIVSFVLLLSFVLYFIFNVTGLFMVQFISTLIYILALCGYVAMLGHIDTTNTTSSYMIKLVSVFSAILFTVVNIWKFWGIKDPYSLATIFVISKFRLLPVLYFSLATGVLSFLVRVTFYVKPKVASDVIKLGRIDNPQVIGVNVPSNIVSNSPIGGAVNTGYNNVNNYNQIAAAATVVKPQPTSVQAVNVQPSGFINPKPLPTMDTSIPVMNNSSQVVNNNIANKPSGPVAVPVVNNNPYNNQIGNNSNIVTIPLNFMNSNVNNQPINPAPVIQQPNSMQAVNPSVGNQPPVVNINNGLPQNMAGVVNPNNIQYNPNNVQR